MVMSRAHECMRNVIPAHHSILYESPRLMASASTVTSLSPLFPLSLSFGLIQPVCQAARGSTQAHGRKSHERSSNGLRFLSPICFHY
jgi:hypothetical protein